MNSVATFIAAPSGGTLDAALLRAAAAHLPESGPPVWLDAGVAADLPFDAPGETLRALRDTILASLAGRPVDVVVQPSAGRRKKLLVADMDSTIIGQECLDELADFVGRKTQVAAITEKAMRGEIAFEPALRERVALLAGLPVDTVDTVIAKRISLNPGARTLVATMRANGAHTILVSGGFTLFTDRIGAMAGFTENRANTLLASGGRFTGKVAEPILGRVAKLATLEDAIIRFGLKAADTLAVGDGANDLAMIERAGLGVAYHAKPRVAEAAAARIDHGDLTALLYAQGYRRDEFLS